MILLYLRSMAGEQKQTKFQRVLEPQQVGSNNLNPSRPHAYCTKVWSILILNQKTTYQELNGLPSS